MYSEIDPVLFARLMSLDLSSRMEILEFMGSVDAPTSEVERIIAECEARAAKAAGPPRAN